MKKIFFICALAATTFFTSCDNDSHGSSQISSTYILTAYDVADQEFEIIFVSDDDKSVYILENNSTDDLSEITEGMRVAAELILVESEIDDFDYAAKLISIKPVIMGEYLSIDEEADDEALADDVLSYVFSNIVLYKGYLNILVGYNTADVDNAKFYLVTNNVVDPEKKEEGFVNLELRYDAAGDDVDSDISSITAKEYNNHISFDLEPLRSLLEDNDGIILRIKTKSNEDAQYVKIGSEYIY